MRIGKYSFNSVYLELRGGVKTIGGHILGIKRAPQTLKVGEKLDNSEVTRADTEAQQMYNHFIRTMFPDRSDHLIIGEEGDLSELAKEIQSFHGEYVWIIDPLDGTKNFVQGENNYCTAVTLLRRGMPILAFLYFPEYNLDGRDELLAEAREDRKSALVNGRRARVAKSSNLLTCSCVVYSSSKVQPEPYYSQAEKIFGKVTYNQGGSGLVNMVRIAVSGIYPTEVLYLKPTPSIWDIAHGYYILTKARGVATFDDGSPIFPLDLTTFDFKQTGTPRLRSIIAGTATAHDLFLRAIS